jgi:hypothetical protein
MPGVTVNATPALSCPPTRTTTLPVVAPEGTGTVMLVMLHDDGVAVTPLNFTVLEPMVAPKLLPVMVTLVPTGPEFGDSVEIDGFTVKLTVLLATPFTVTTMFPVMAPAGTGATMLPALHDVGVAATPLNVKALVPCVAPKWVPVTVTLVPTTPVDGLRLEMFGLTVNVTPLLATPPTVTTTFPVVVPVGTGAVMLVALQAVGVAVVPLKVNVLVP